MQSGPRLLRSNPYIPCNRCGILHAHLTNPDDSAVSCVARMTNEDVVGSCGGQYSGERTDADVVLPGRNVEQGTLADRCVVAACAVFEGSFSDGRVSRSRGIADESPVADDGIVLTRCIEPHGG